MSGRDAFLRRVADVYASEVERGNLRPNKTIAEMFNANRRTVESWVRDARLRGYLPSTTPGRCIRQDVPRDVLDLIDELVTRIEAGRVAG